MSKIKTFLKKCRILIEDELLYIRMAIFGVEVISSKTILKKSLDEKKIIDALVNKLPEDSDAKTLWERLQAMPYDESNLGKVTISFGGWRPPVNSDKDPKKK